MEKKQIVTQASGFQILYMLGNMTSTRQIVTQASGFQILYMLGNMTSTRKYAIETGVIAYLGVMPCCVKTAKVHNNE